MSRARRALDLEAIHPKSYPPIFRERLGGTTRRRLGEAFGLEQFGVNLSVIPPGGQSALRHWHSHEDELLYILSGEVVLVTNEGEEIMRAGDVIGFPSGKPDAHHLQNRGSEPAQVLEVGTRVEADVCRYPDDDLAWATLDGDWFASHKDGTKY